MVLEEPASQPGPRSALSGARRTSLVVCGSLVASKKETIPFRGFMWCPVGESGSTHAKLRCRESLEPGIGQERCYPRESGEKKLKGKDYLKERGPWRKREVQWYLSVGRVAGVREWKGLGGCLEDMTGTGRMRMRTHG